MKAQPVCVSAALLLALWGPLAATAQTFRCELNGRVTFQQHACTDARRVGAADPTPQLADALRGAALCEAHART